ncbi:hypothetical protein DL769_006898 [Monosporascus sp. CRB-8-3]|nr:hypothetical protein DL769_006898 [Monosporascus sp. CRB-8-3]
MAQDHVSSAKIGNDNVPTYSSEPTSWSATATTATQVLSTSSIIVGCNVEDDSSTTTTTASCPASATTCSEEVVIVTLIDDSVDPLPTDILVTNDALATSIFNYVDSFWSAQDAADSTTIVTSTTSADLPTLTGTTQPPPSTLPIETPTGSSCVSTVTTSICSIPQEPCGPSLSCASWVASSTTTSTPTEAAPPTPTATWILTLYNTECEEEIQEYYSLEGYGEQGPDKTCIDLKKLPQLSDTSESCRFFTGGGTSWSDCSEATFDNPTSFVIRNGFCTPYPEEGCQGIRDGFVAPGITDTSHPGCNNIEPKFGLPDTWRSMRCVARLSQD